MANGVNIDGLDAAVGFPAYRRAAFEIPDDFFQRIATAVADQ